MLRKSAICFYRLVQPKLAKRWSPEEETSLLHLYHLMLDDSRTKTGSREQRAEKWQLIPTLLPGPVKRTEIQCRDKLARMRRQLGTFGGRWTREEKKQLDEAGKLLGQTRWAAIAQYMKTRRTSEQVFRHVAHENKRQAIGEWSPHEDLTLFKGIKVLAPRLLSHTLPLWPNFKRFNAEKWAEIADRVEGRTAQQCWHRWSTSLRSKSTTGKNIWSDEEVQKLVRIKRRNPRCRLMVLESHFPNRTWKQIASKWYKI